MGGPPSKEPNDNEGGLTPYHTSAEGLERRGIKVPRDIKTPEKRHGEPNVDAMLDAAHSHPALEYKRTMTNDEGESFHHFNIKHSLMGSAVIKHSPKNGATFKIYRPEPWGDVPTVSTPNHLKNNTFAKVAQNHGYGYSHKTNMKDYPVYYGGDHQSHNEHQFIHPSNSRVNVGSDEQGQYATHYHDNFSGKKVFRNPEELHNHLTQHHQNLPAQVKHLDVTGNDPSKFKTVLARQFSGSKILKKV